MVIEMGYISYSRQANGMCNENNGISTEFFDKFVPKFYGLFSRRIREINEVREANFNKSSNLPGERFSKSNFGHEQEITLYYYCWR